MKILAIETSCDETAVSIIDAGDDKIDVLSNIISSQVTLHAKWGGVVPNLAAREHTKNIIPVLTESLKKAQTTKNEIDLIAVTHGPGLIPALLSGVSVAKSLAYAWKKPLIGIHHIEGHIYANWIKNPSIAFPVLALVVSGGHTQLVLMQDHCHYDIIGQTQDDAVGEAFDKVARLLGLGYPGGPIISAKALAYEKTHTENPITLPRPMKNSGDFHFSFSGIKTAVLYTVKTFREEHNLFDDTPLPDDFVASVAHAFQTAAVDVLTHKTLKALEKHNAKSVVIAGGVSANTQLRNALKQAIAENSEHTQFFVPPLTYCLDNAAMIAAAAFYRYHTLTQKQQHALTTGWHTVTAKANRDINEKLKV
ncbi:MAG: tRNA (adenosine(37)-N6)-threonylcarbamoyltransferase complex transferase subunit TsaD [Candidatus Moraniibacteriota bacterium]|nr:MAG: tRNA (adenosine(37)-N6)-threonylcarbamoyltransferase complex transferase subunit TsaD [Candidatus Moranbacteria bacterium]